MARNEFKVFLSSANRLKKHRDIVKSIVDEVNDNMSKYTSCRLGLYRWEKESTPEMGRPQEVIFAQSEYQDIDIYIGLIGSYLGPGTEEEFNEAFASYQAVGKPEIMMFQDISPLKIENVDLEQINKSQKFIKNFNEGGTHPGLIMTYKNNRELEQRIRKALTEYVLKKRNASLQEKSVQTPVYPAFIDRIAGSGISNFYIGRDEWQLYRSQPRLADYLLTATESVKIATYWLAQGSIEGVFNIYKKLIDRGVFVEVVTIEPTDNIANTLAPDVNESPETIKTYVTLALEKLTNLKKKLPAEKQALFSIRTSKAIPQAAVIFLDSNTEKGKIQLEFRPYGVPRNDSFSIEVSYMENARLYELLEESWNTFFEDAVSVDEQPGRRS